MRIKLFILLMLLTFTFSMGSFGAEIGSAMPLEEAKKYAASNNFEVTALRKALDEARAQRARLLSHYLPTIGIAGGVDSQIARDRNVAGVGYLYGNLNLFRGFEDSYKVSIANLEIEKVEIRLSRAEFRVGLDVEQQFSRYLFTKLAISLKKTAWEVNESQKKLAKKKQESGLAVDSDLMEFDLRDSLLQSDLASLEQELEVARIALKKLLGEEVGSRIEPVGNLQHLHLKGDLMEFQKLLREQSESVLIAKKDLAIAEYESKLASSKWIPEIDVETKAGYLPLELKPVDGGTSFRGMLLAKFDLFSGLDTINQQREGTAKKLRLEAQLKNTALTTSSEVETLFRKIKAIEARIHLEEQNEARSKKYYNAIIREYKRGVRNSADVRLAAEVLFDSSLRRQNFKYEFITQKLELERILGISISSEPMPENGPNPQEDHEFLKRLNPNRNEN